MQRYLQFHNLILTLPQNMQNCFSNIVKTLLIDCVSEIPKIEDDEQTWYSTKKSQAKHESIQNTTKIVTLVQPSEIPNVPEKKTSNKFAPFETKNETTKRHICNYCCKELFNSTGLRHHIYTHTNEWPFRCCWPGCAKGTATKRDLTKHERTHTGHSLARFAIKNLRSQESCIDTKKCVLKKVNLLLFMLHTVKNKSKRNLIVRKSFLFFNLFLSCFLFFLLLYTYFQKNNFFFGVLREMKFERMNKRESITFHLEVLNFSKYIVVMFIENSSKNLNFK
ncbi:hypothetical protein RFI_03061 [Reticulomyxa filosa]|uniref:C2H2-type domain-containing protein n=1 Tax=Reticulomyxa filosa TaxID=46433 RepID=X6P7D4_RETFI|nr:hypothetical protein RFI_03061 [Reticulomyxa filosa]|eukprot:ETO34033.1 hypothetical protein RFI_03061 [Reticulomyxa filosa]